MDTTTTVTVQGREIQQMPDGSWYCLDVRPGRARADFLSIRWGDSLRRIAFVRGHNREYVCTKPATTDRWQCTCEGFKGYGSCYHVVTLQGAERILAGQPKPAARRPAHIAPLAGCLNAR